MSSFRGIELTMPHQALSQLLQMEQQVRQAESLTALSFCLCNQTRQVVPFDQSVLLLGEVGQSLVATASNDHPVIDRTSPLITWIEKTANQQMLSEHGHEVQIITPPAQIQELSSQQVLWIPLLHPAKHHHPVGALWLARHQPWTDRDIAMLKHLSGTYAHAIQTFRQPSSLRQVWHWAKTSHVPRYALIASLLLAFVPVRLSVLAPAEVIAQQPSIITSPLQGVVKEVLVKSGDTVSKGQLLIQLDPQENLNRYQIAEQEHLKAVAEWHSAQQSGFIDPKQKAKVAELEAQVQVKEAEKHFAYQQWQKTSVTSQQEGIAIIDDPQSWQGKPVAMGEKVLQIANPSRIELKIMLPTADAIAIQSQAEVKFFPDTDPLSVIDGQLTRSAYEPEKTPEDIIAYKLIAHLEPTDPISRIGSRGTAKVYGESVTLFYYLFRRPITATRQWLGW